MDKIEYIGVARIHAMSEVAVGAVKMAIVEEGNAGAFPDDLQLPYFGLEYTIDCLHALRLAYTELPDCLAAINDALAILNAPSCDDETLECTCPLHGETN